MCFFSVVLQLVGSFVFFSFWEWLALLIQKKCAPLQETEGVSFWLCGPALFILLFSQMERRTFTQIAPKGRIRQKRAVIFSVMLFSFHLQLQYNQQLCWWAINNWVSLCPVAPVYLNVVQVVTYSSILMIFCKPLLPTPAVASYR